MEAFLEMGENWYQCLFRSPEMSFDRQLVNFVVIEEFLALSGVVMLDLLDLMTSAGIFSVLLNQALGR